MSQFFVEASGGSVPVPPFNIITFVAQPQSPFTATIQSQFISVDSSGGPVSIVIPTAPATGTVYIIKDRKGTASTNNITVTAGGDTIDFAASLLIAGNFGSVELLYDGMSNYEVF